MKMQTSQYLLIKVKTKKYWIFKFTCSTHFVYGWMDCVWNTWRRGDTLCNIVYDMTLT